MAVAIVLIINLLGDALTTQFTFTTTPESQRGLDLIEEMRGVPFSTNEVVIVQSDTFNVDEPEFQQFAQGVFADLEALGPDVIRKGTLINYYQTGAPFLVSKDRQTTIMPLTEVVPKN